MFWKTPVNDRFCKFKSGCIPREYCFSFQTKCLNFWNLWLWRVGLVGSWGFYPPYSPKKFSRFRHENTFVFCVQQEVFGVFVFPYFIFSWYILAKWFVKNVPKMELLETTSYFSETRILTNKEFLQIIFFRGCAKLIITCQSKQKSTN